MKYFLKLNQGNLKIMKIKVQTMDDSEKPFHKHLFTHRSMRLDRLCKKCYVANN